jgi:predicted Ser/Thr protein kinase/tetratricopeptide (TPR) repeat protein
MSIDPRSNSPQIIWSGSTLQDPGSAADPVAQHPERIGAYRILGVLGRGGMGIVYRAEQERPRRAVALKVVRPERASAEALRRFEHEAHLLGRLHHPGIAQIFEAGSIPTAAGPHPFFAMELIAGRPLTQYAAERRLGARARLELMIKVCEAVQHAHQQGIIHRDLKPGNILVEDTGQPKVLDFGVARVTSDDTSLATSLTDPGQILGTVPYMSPEQVAADPDAIDTRSDVYALGVITYELLTGRLPYPVRGRPPLEVMRIIREQGPQPLSSTDRSLRGDLETILSKALEKDRERRYASASEFAADLGRHLRDEPILARPPGALYQLGKFARRNKALTAGAAAALLGLAGSVVGLGLAWDSQRRAARAEGQRVLEVERRLAESHAADARRFLARGQWREALAAYDRALGAGIADSAGLRIDRIQAFINLHNYAAARGELDALAARPDRGSREAEYLLWRAELLYNRSAAESERADELIRRALELGLPEAAREYALGILAPTTPEAADHLRRAVAADPYHVLARMSLGVLLNFLGEREEARRHVELG